MKEITKMNYMMKNIQIIIQNNETEKLKNKNLNLKLFILSCYHKKPKWFSCYLNLIYLEFSTH